MPQSQTSAVQLHFTNADGHVTVTPSNEDRFTIKVERAIELLQQSSRREEFERQFKLLLKVLGEWLENSSEIKQAFLTLRDGGICLVVVRENAPYDAEFEDSLSDLDYDIANDSDLDLIQFTAIALPPVSDESLNTFLNEDVAFILYGA